MCNALSMKLYIVGGAVRDILLGKTPTDVDMAFEGAHEHVEDIVHIVGKSVRVFLCQGCEYTPLKGNSILEDLHSRDLTINAMALPLGAEDGCFYAHPLALHDMAQGVLRPASDTSFFDDPLRVYRVARFAATLTHTTSHTATLAPSPMSGAQFSVHDSAIMQGQAVIRQGLHANVPVERVGREFVKALHGAYPVRFFDVLVRMGALTPWFQEITTEHVALLRHIQGACALTQWLCVCAPFARQRDTKAALALATRLRLSKKYADSGRIMAAYHTAALHYSALSLQERCELLCHVDKCHLSHVFWNTALHPESEKALRALALIKSVCLPEKWRNKGARSGQYLRALQCEVLRSASLSSC